MRHLVYKTKDNTISICTPVPKERVQKDLIRKAKDTYVADEKKPEYTLHNHAKAIYINNHHTAGQYEVARGMSRAHHDKRIEWANTVQDFANLTDDEFEKLIECDAKDGHQYKFWIDEEKLIKGDIHRDAWSDIDANGNIVYDPAKAKETTISRLANDVMLAREAYQAAEDSGNITSEITQALVDARNKVSTARALDIVTHQDVIDKLKPLHKSK